MSESRISLDLRSVCSCVASTLFEYYTPRIVHIKSKKVGFINRFLQLVILSYIIGYVIVYKKGYQEFDTCQSAITTKLKGVVFSNLSHLSDIGVRTWDVADYVIPPQEIGATFVMTNVIPTLNQTQSTCPEDPTIDGSFCIDDSSCPQGKILDKGNGPFTGKCVNSANEKSHVCEIYGWCLVEDDSRYKNMTDPVLFGSHNFTMFIKNNIEFPKFGVRRRNLPDVATNESTAFINNCTYNATDPQAKYCPFFRLDTIVQGAGYPYSAVAVEGGVIEVVINWDCNLDFSVDDCLPEYSFKRLDRGDYSISRGFNFRYADYYAVKENDTFKQYRNLYKATGIIFVINVQGKAGKFSIIPLLLNFGSGLALLALTTVICDLIVLYVLKAKKYYREHKYLLVESQESFQILHDDSDQGSHREVKRRHHNPSVGTSYEGHGTDT
ncbi:P2X purinoceptor 4-like isoform X1 [Biomphalaria glabrata]|uniref:P2X purinoceptor 4-like isoform X1 n=1 Tax=Biomphalaria glabrata TaxID=6526 RepID=A0A9U8EL42_BIOGL|nr:P2X purinoceptor 4-like isoform X1 [Biomphalaria glabrata]